MRRLLFFNLFIFSIILALSIGCSKIEKGYLSDNIFYQINPFTVQQGVTTTSSSLVANGSTAPLHVDFISMKNMETGALVDSIFSKPGVITTYTGAITYEDSTIELLQAKLKDSSVAPFSLNPIGGRLQFTEATKYLPAGKYALSIAVSNVKGSREIPDACIINLTPITKISEVTYTAWTTSDDAGTFYYPSSSLSVTIDRDPLGPNKIIFKFLDKNGNAFDPSAGEVIARPDGRPNFHDWCPYYTPVLTSTGIEYGYPGGVQSIPIFQYTKYGTGFASNICYYRIPAAFTDINLNINPVSSQKFYISSGTYTVTYHLTIAARKPKN